MSTYLSLRDVPFYLVIFIVAMTFVFDWRFALVMVAIVVLLLCWFRAVLAHMGDGDG